MSSITQEDGFTEVTRGRKKHKASNSPTLPSQPKSGSFEPTLGTPVHPRPNLENKISVILSGVDGKFKIWRSMMAELRQYHGRVLPIFQLEINDPIEGEALQIHVKISPVQLGLIDFISQQ